MRDIPHGPQVEGINPVSLAMRDVLTLASLARVRLAERLGMGLRDVEAVEHVMTGDGDLGPAELARRLGVTTAAATQGVQRLEDAGHLTRSPHPSDRRRWRLGVTASGAGHVMSELGPLLALLGSATDGMSARDQRVVQRYLQRTAQAYRDYLASTPDD